MNINEVLFSGVEEYFRRNDYLRQIIEEFLLTSPKRKEKAFEIIRRIMLPHGKEGLLSYMIRLAKIEYKIKELQPELRDHVIHAVLTFILGIYLKEKLFRPLKRIPINTFQWEIASLFHDVAYPFEIAENVGRSFVNGFKDITEDIGISSPDIRYKGIITGLERLTDGINGIDLIQEQLEKWDLKIDAKEEYERNNSTGKICHGIISSLAILNIIDLLYKKFNPQRNRKLNRVNNIDWDQRHFENDIVPACSAIFVHNLPSSSFDKTRISFKKAPLAFLLKISDSLQEWERPSFKNKKGYSPSQFDMKFGNNQLIFVAGKAKDEVENEIFESLDTEGMKVEIIIKE